MKIQNERWPVQESLLSTSEAAELLGITVGHLRNLTYRGKVRYYKIGNRNRYTRRDLGSIVRSGPNFHKQFGKVVFQV